MKEILEVSTTLSLWKSYTNTDEKNAYIRKCTTLSACRNVGISLNVDGLANDKYKIMSNASKDFQYLIINIFIFTVCGIKQ